MWLRSLVDVVKSSVSRTRWYAWSWRMQLSELLIRGLSRIQKWPEMYSDWHYVWEAEEGIQTQKLKNTCPSLLSPNLEKPGQLQEPPQPGGGFHPKNRSDLDCHRFETWNLICRVSHETKQVSDLYERPPAEVDFRSSKRLHENGSGFELPSQLLMIAAVTNLKSVRDNQTVSQEQMNPFLSPCFIHAAYCGTLFYTILQDSINSLFSPFSITHSSKQLKPTNLPDLDAFWKANTFSCSKGLIFVLWSVS